MKKSSPKIKSSMMIAEVVSRWPKTAKVLTKHGMHCIGCPMAMSETLAQASKVHGINLKKMLEELNKAAK
jgi:hybrid cluster-associated redox disulfide protein